MLFYSEGVPTEWGDNQRSGAAPIECIGILDHLAEIGKFVLPGLVMIKTRVKPATQAGRREMFGKVFKVRAMKARTVVKALAVSALKESF